MMYPRLKLARNLLKDDGIIFISIDDKEIANLKLLCDEIFGAENYVSIIGIEITKTQGMKVKSAKEGSIVKNYEYVLCYSRKEGKIVENLLYDFNDGYDTHFSYYINPETLEKKSLVEYFKDNHVFKAEFEKYQLDIKLSNIEKLLYISPKFKKLLFEQESKNIFQDMACNINIGKDIQEKLKNNTIVNYNNYLLTISSGGKLRQYSSLYETLRFNDEYNSEFGRTTIRGNLWKNFYSDMMNVAKEGLMDFSNGKKPVRLIKQLSKWVGLSNNDIVLDFFSGSATTAHATMQLNSEEYESVYLSKHLEVFLKEIKNKNLKKALKTSGIEKSELDSAYNSGKNGDERFTKFYNDYLNFKISCYITQIIRGKTVSKALKNSNLTDEELKDNLKEIESRILDKQMNSVIGEIAKNRTTRQAAKKARIRIDEIYRWYLEGKKGNEKFKDFADIYHEFYVEVGCEIFQNFLNKGKTPKQILKIMNEDITREDYEFWIKNNLISDKNVEAKLYTEDEIKEKIENEGFRQKEEKSLSGLSIIGC